MKLNRSAHVQVLKFTENNDNNTHKKYLLYLLPIPLNL